MMENTDLPAFSGACDQKISTAAEKLLCMVKSYEYRYRAQDKPSQMQRRNRSMLEGPRRMEWRLTHWVRTVQIIYPFRMIILYAGILNFTVTTRAHHASAAVRPLEN